nr:DUF3027 domain-containing protein [Corynebacterium sp. sy017]
MAELGEGEVGEHIGIGHIGPHEATHRFRAHVSGYRGWEWNAVIACAEGSNYITVSEVALVPGRSALQAPRWIPYEQRVRPGDLGPTDVLPPRPDDERLTEEESQSVLDRGTRKKLTPAGLSAAKTRWVKGKYGPDSDFAEHASLYCKTCAFFIPMPEPIGAHYGVCTNEFSADGHVIHHSYGCGAHSDTPPEQPLGHNGAEAFDDEQPLDINFADSTEVDEEQSIF